MHKSNVRVLAGILRQLTNSRVPVVRSVCYLEQQSQNIVLNKRDYMNSIPSERHTEIIYYFPSLGGLTPFEKLAKIIDGCGGKDKGRGACDDVLEGPPARSPCNSTTEKPCESLPCGFPQHPGICDGKVFTDEKPFDIEDPECLHAPPCPKKKKVKKVEPLQKAIGTVSGSWPATTATFEETLFYSNNRSLPMLFAKEDDCDDGPKDQLPCKNMDKPCISEKKPINTRRPMPCNKQKTPCTAVIHKKKREEFNDDPCAAMYHKRCPPRTSKGDCEKPIVDPCAPRGCIKDK